ncbi:unnamed protein product [Adineta ricciae]|uniref:Uncharacterized protein n=1 Tax=Adineta ricciae TaxID=249248 RepID=A0A815B8W6_ADIRI|nr:unnamed protein product [Adineta ricciae]
MRLRDLFRGPSSTDRKSTLSLVPSLDANTFVNAAQDKDTDSLHKYLLTDQPDPSTKATALHVAVESANLRAIQMLLQAGAQINVTDISSSTPLHIAAYMGYEEVVQILLSHGADMFKHDNTGRNAFHLAVSTGNLRLVQHFLTTQDPEQTILHKPDAQNWTPLMCACASNQPAICAFLLSHHADLCAINDRHMTALHIAAFLGSLPVLQELLTSSNDDNTLQALNQGDHRNQTPLFYACIEGHLDIALVLIRAGANAYHLDNEDQTCLHAMLSSTIVLKRHICLFYRFIQFVDYREHQDYLGRTLLDLAYLNQLNTIIYLLNMLNYKTNANVVFISEQTENRLCCHDNQVLSLRQLCILRFKNSVVYHRNQRQPTQHDLLEKGLQEIFQISSTIDLPSLQETNSIELPVGKSLDDISLLQQQQSTKYQKSSKTIKNPEKKMRKTSTIFSTTSSSTNKWASQVDLQHSHSTWSVLTHKFKGQRTLPPLINPNQALTEQSADPLQSLPAHQMKSLALKMLTSPMKLDELLDFPSLNSSHLLDDDLRLSMKTYKLLDINASN